jgi:hypothetical protein
MKRKTIVFAGSSVAVEWDGDQADRLVDFVLGSAPAEAHASPSETYRLVSEDEVLTLSRDGRRIYEGSNAYSAAEMLMGEVCRRLAEQSCGGLLFHAAGLTWQGRGLIMPGIIAAGKTTLTAWLTLVGFHYLTDELVFVPDGTSTMKAFTRPLNLKDASRESLAEIFDFNDRAEEFFSHPRGALIPPTLLHPNNELSEPQVSAIVFTRYAPDSEFAFEPLTGAQAGLALMECLVNARNLPEHGLTEIARLARSAPAYRLRYSRFEQIGDRIQASLS